jgi:hypothetical protein
MYVLLDFLRVKPPGRLLDRRAAWAGAPLDLHVVDLDVFADDFNVARVLAPLDAVSALATRNGRGVRDPDRRLLEGRKRAREPQPGAECAGRKLVDLRGKKESNQVSAYVKRTMIINRTN